MNTLTNKKQSNKEVAQYWFNAISAGDIEAICDITSANWIMHGGLPGLPAGPEGVRKLFESFGSIEQQWIVEDMIAEGDKVVIRATSYCHQQIFLGIPSHGRRQVFTATFIHRIVNGEICETWRNADDLGRVLQLGAAIVTAKPEQEKNKSEVLFEIAMTALQKIR